MDKEAHEKGERPGSDGAKPRAEAYTELEASGDAIIIANALHAVADSFREVAASIRNVTSTPEGKDDDQEFDHYLDGSKQ